MVRNTLPLLSRTFSYYYVYANRRFLCDAFAKVTGGSDGDAVLRSGEVLELVSHCATGYQVSRQEYGEMKWKLGFHTGL